MVKSTRARIEHEAITLFAERGYHGVSVPMLTKAAGLSPGALYRHFESKSALVNTVYRDSKQMLMRSLADGFPVGDDPRSQFRWFWHRLVDFARLHETRLAFLELHHHAPYLDAASRRVEAQSLELVQSFFALEATRARVKGLSPAALMAIVWGILSGLFKGHRQGHLPWDETLIEQAESCAWHAIANIEPV